MYKKIIPNIGKQAKKRKNFFLRKKRAANGARTRDFQLGKLALYQLSYCRFFYRKMDVELMLQKYKIYY